MNIYNAFLTMHLYIEYHSSHVYRFCFLLIDKLFYKIDRNECQDGSHKCVGRSSCVNTQGSYRCMCPVGYKLTEDQRNCQGKCKDK